MGRGALTDKAQEIAKKFLGYEFDTKSLRLLLYIQHCLMNSQGLDNRRMNAHERKILGKFKRAGYITDSSLRVAVTREFWDFMNDILFETYIDIH